MRSSFVQDDRFEEPVSLTDANTLRNLSEPAATKTITDTCKKALNELTIQDRGDAEIRDTIKFRQTRLFAVKDQAYLVPTKSVFKPIIGDKGNELSFARFLDNSPDIVSWGQELPSVELQA